MEGTDAVEVTQAELLREYQLFAGETAGKCLGLAMSTEHPAPDEVLMGIFHASQELAAKARLHNAAIQSLSTRTEELVKALEQIGRAFDEWDPDGKFASTALSQASTLARTALASHRREGS